MLMNLPGEAHHSTPILPLHASMCIPVGCVDFSTDAHCGHASFGYIKIMYGLASSSLVSALICAAMVNYLRIPNYMLMLFAVWSQMTQKVLLVLRMSFEGQHCAVIP